MSLPGAPGWNLALQAAACLVFAVGAWRASIGVRLAWDSEQAALAQLIYDTVAKWLTRGTPRTR